MRNSLVESLKTIGPYKIMSFKEDVLFIKSDLSPFQLEIHHVVFPRE